MTEEELLEALASEMHASWSRWTKYLLSKCEVGIRGLIIPHEYVADLRKQCNTAYKKLSEHEKISNRDEAYHVLPIVQRFAKENKAHDDEQ